MHLDRRADSRIGSWFGVWTNGGSQSIPPETWTPRSNFSTSTRYSDLMTEPTSKRQCGIAKQDDLLRVWLDLFNHVDNPLRRQAAKFRQTQRPRRDLSNRRTSCEVVELSALRAVRPHTA
jgi:hypothetical protein